MSGGTRYGGGYRRSVGHGFTGQSLFDGAPRNITANAITIYWVNLSFDKEGEWLQLFETSVVPINGTVARLEFGPTKTGLASFYNFGTDGITFRNGLSMAVSSTIHALTATAMPADYDISFGLNSAP